MGTFLNFACPGVYIEQNAPRAVRSKARVWTERPARGAFYNCPTSIPTPSVNFFKTLYCLSTAPSIVRFHKDQGSQKMVTDNGETKIFLARFFRPMS